MKRIFLPHILLTAVICAACRIACAAPVYLDSTFGPYANGTVTQAVGVESEAQAILIRDNKINIIGTSLIDSIYYVTVIRYLATGELDTSFGTGGILNLTTQEGFSATNALSYDADRILIMGSAIVNKDPMFVGARIYNDGTLDPTLGGDGIVVYPAYGLIQNGFVQEDGKTVVLVSAAVGGNEQLALYLARVNTDGSLDGTFGSDSTGIVKIPLPWNSMYAKSICVSTTKILVSGYIGANGGEKIFCARYGADGLIDDTFGDHGVVMTQMPGTDINAHAHSIGVQTSGKIVVTGAAGNSFVAVRYTTAGALDPDFGTAGIAVIPVGSYAHGYSAVIQSDDKIVMAGLSDDHFAVVRLTASGALDTTFGTGGIATATIGDYDKAETIALQSDGKILVTGSSDQKTALARYRADNTDFVTIQSPADGSTVTSSTFAASGNASQSGRTIRLKIDGTIITTTTTDASGNWNTGTMPAVANGEHTILADMLDGESVIASHSHTVTVNAASDTVAITSPTSGETITTQTPTVSGRASQPSYNVRVSIDGSVIDTVTTNALGAWQKTTPALTNGSHTILAELMSGETVLASDTKTCTVSIAPFITFTVPAPGSTITTSTTDIAGTTSEGSTGLQIFFDGQFFNAITTSATGAWNAGTSATLQDGSSHGANAYKTSASGSVNVAASTYFTVDLP